MMFATVPILNILIWLPIASGIVLLCAGNKLSAAVCHIVATSSSFGCLLLLAYILYSFDSTSWQLQFIEYISWLPNYGIHYAVGVDGISVLLLALTCLMSLLGLLYENPVATTKPYYQYWAALLLLQGLLSGVFVATDAILFYSFCEVMLIPIFLIIGLWGGARKVYAATKLFLYTILGSAPLLLSLIYLLGKIKAADFTTAAFTIMQMQELTLSLVEQHWLFWGLFLAFAIKLSMVPLHSWLPDAHVAAPTAGSVILAALMLKVGGYGMLRFLLPITPQACYFYSKMILLIASIAISYAGLIALVQQELKRLIAYSSITQMGLVSLGLFLWFADPHNTKQASLATLGITGAIVHMLMHGLIVGALFFCVGCLQRRTNTTLIKDHRGIAIIMPKLAVVFLLFVLASLGLPGTIGFVGEFLILLAAAKAQLGYALVIAILFVLSASYLLWMYSRIMFGNPISSIIKHHDLMWHEIIILIILAGLTLLFGCWPQPIIAIINNTVIHLVEIING